MAVDLSRQTFRKSIYRQQLFALLSKTAPFYFHNARWIHLRSGRAISLDRKFNTVTEASIKIDENIPADGENEGLSPVVLRSNAESCRFPVGRDLHRDNPRKIPKGARQKRFLQKKTVYFICIRGSEDVLGDYILQNYIGCSAALLFKDLFLK